MSAQIKFFKKNWIDLAKTGNITVTDSTAFDNGQDFVNFMRNRNNTSAWMTTGSNDAANTTLVLDMVTGHDVDSILLVKHNLKAFTIKYWDVGMSAYVDFVPAINQTTNTDSTTLFSFTQVSTPKIQMIITGTQVANSDKKITQFIITKTLVGGGQFQGWPMIKSPMFSQNKKISTMLSGKRYVVENVGSSQAQLQVDWWKIDADMQIVEAIYTAHEGVLMWLCGGDETQFANKRIMYRKEDILLVRPTDDYKPEYQSGQYKNGMKISMTLVEATD